jgi:general L-amino acid transport system substrate-binding protein
MWGGYRGGTPHSSFFGQVFLRRWALKLVVVVAGSLDASGPIAQADTLERVKQRGTLNCGVNPGLPGFSQPDDKGGWRGFDVDYCKAIAIAVVGDPTKANFVPTNSTERFSLLASGDIDVLVRNTTWTSARDSVAGLAFVGVNYYDGQGFMVKASRGVQSANELNGVTVCMLSGTTTEGNVASYFKANNMVFQSLIFDKFNDAVRAYLSGRCDVYTADMSSLYSARVQQARPNDHVLLPEIISKEPLGPLVRQDDFRWFTVVKWVHFVLVNAEELGVTRSNVDEMAQLRNNTDVGRLLGREGDFGRDLGIDSDFAAKIIRSVGNYGEIFERNVGSGSRLKIARGLNNLWNKGGLQYAPPVR